MRFGMICEANGIEHRLTKLNHPWTNGQVERKNRIPVLRKSRVSPLIAGPGQPAYLQRRRPRRGKQERRKGNSRGQCTTPFTLSGVTTALVRGFSGKRRQARQFHGLGRDGIGFKRCKNNSRRYRRRNVKNIELPPPIL